MAILAAMVIFATVVGWESAIYAEPSGTAHRVVGTAGRGAAQAAVLLAGGLLIFGVCRWMVRRGWI